MAKPLLPKPEGGLHDPLDKWDTLNNLRDAATTDVLEGAAEVNRLRDALQQPNLSHGARLALSKSLIDSKVNLEKAKRVGQKIVDDLNATRRLDQQINFRLNSIKTYLSNNQALDAEVLKGIKASETALQELLEEAKDLSGSVEGIDSILERVLTIEDSLQDLPKDLRLELKDQAATLKTIEARQKEAEDFLIAHGKKMDALKAGIKGWAAKKAMGVADRLGIGAFSVGGIIRAGIGTKNVVKGTYKKVNDTRKYLKTLAEAKRMSADPSKVKGATPGSYKGLNDRETDRGRDRDNGGEYTGNSKGQVRSLIDVVQKLAKHYSVKSVLNKLTGRTDPEDGPPKNDEKNSLVAPKKAIGVGDSADPNSKLVQEVHGIRTDFKATISDSTEQANDQLDVQKSVESRVTEYLEYAQRYQRRLLDALGSLKKKGGAGDSIFGSLLKGGVGGLIKKLLPGLGGLLAGGMAGGLIRKLSGRVIGLIWGAIKAATGPLTRLMLSGVGLLTRAGSIVMSSASVFLKKGATLAIELGKKAAAFAINAASALAKLAIGGATAAVAAGTPVAQAAAKKLLPRVLGAVKRNVGLGMLLHTDSLNANEDAELAKYRARGATIDGPTPALAGSKGSPAVVQTTPNTISPAAQSAIEGTATLVPAHHSTEMLKSQVATRKEKVVQLEALIRSQQQEETVPEGYAAAQKELVQQHAGLKDLELRLSIAQSSGSQSQAPETQEVSSTAVSNSVSSAESPTGSTSTSTPSGSSSSMDAGAGASNPKITNKGAPYTGTTGSKVSDHANKLFQIRGGANTDGLNAGFQSNLVGMAKEYYEQTGKQIPINSGYRSLEEQAQLYATKPKGYAARSGRSIHNFGGALDTDSVIGNDLEKRGLLKKYGMERPHAHEKWHIQPMGLTLAAARAGIFSADEPHNQGGEAKVQTSGSPKTASSAPVTPANSIQVASSSPVAGSSSGGSTYNTDTYKGTTTAVARPSAQALSAPEPPAFAQPAKEEKSISTSTPHRQTTSMGSNPRYGVRDIPTFDQSDSLFLAMNLGVMG